MSEKAMTDYEKMVAASVAEAVQALASGARIRIVDDGYHGFSYVLEAAPLKQPDGRAMDELFHCGWLESMANGGTFKLSDAGQLAYQRSMDETGDGRLIAPHGWQN